MTEQETTGFEVLPEIPVEKFDWHIDFEHGDTLAGKDVDEFINIYQLTETHLRATDPALGRKITKKKEIAEKMESALREIFGALAPYQLNGDDAPHYMHYMAGISKNRVRVWLP